MANHWRHHRTTEKLRAHARLACGVPLSVEDHDSSPPLHNLYIHRRPSKCGTCSQDQLLELPQGELLNSYGTNYLIFVSHVASVWMFVKGELYHSYMHVLLGDGIFNADGEMWKKQRKTASFEFASKNLRDFSTIVFREYGIKLSSILCQATIDNRNIDMQVFSRNINIYKLYSAEYKHNSLHKDFCII